MCIYEGNFSFTSYNFDFKYTPSYKPQSIGTKMVEVFIQQILSLLSCKVIFVRLQQLFMIYLIFP